MFLILICAFVFALVVVYFLCCHRQTLPSGKNFPCEQILKDISPDRLKSSYCQADLECLSLYAKHMITRNTLSSTKKTLLWIEIDRKLDTVLYGLSSKKASVKN